MNDLSHIFSHCLLQTYFQPIVNLTTGEAFGIEALVRGPQNSDLHMPNNLFNAAEDQDRLLELEFACRRQHIRSFARTETNCNLFMNVNPLALEQKGFSPGFTKRYLNKIGVSPEQVVIEITESSPIHNYQLIRNALSHYRDMGFRIAIDDLGAGYASLRHWIELKPEFIKIDRSFIAGIDQNRYQHKLVATLASIGADLGCTVIAEGIETEEECKTVEGVGITFGQGLYLGEPQPSSRYMIAVGA